MSPKEFIDQLQAIRFDCAFNPYSERCSEFDLADAPKLRATVLHKIIVRATTAPLDSIWVGRDLGYRGGRRTGLAFTDDPHLESHARRWNVALQRPTEGDMVLERTATVIWNALSRINDRVFLWNVFPLHPFHRGRTFSNRAHNASEREVGTDLLVELIDLLRPAKILPIGKDAAAVVNQINGQRPVLPVRHPSYGGQREFMEQIFTICGETHD